MIYLIAYLLTGNAKTYHEEIIADLYHQFSIRKPFAIGIPPHVTLKSPFKLDEQYLQELDADLQEFAGQQKPTSFRFSGLDDFNGKVLFTTISAPNSAKKQQQQLIEMLQRYCTSEEIRDQDRNIHFHATLATSYPTKKHIDRMYTYVRNHYGEYTKKDTFDHIAILYHKNGKWWVYRRYFFKNQ